MNKYIKKVNEFCMLSKNFDIKTAFDYIENRHTLGHEKFSIYVQNFFERYFEPVIRHYENGGDGLYPIKKYKQIDGNIIWVCWWQGKFSMPDVVDMCVTQMETLCKQLQNVKFILVTKDNYQDFIELPAFVIEKLEKGNMSLTTFSDILRQCLLSSYGGAWIDATVLCTSVKGIEELFKKHYFSIKIESNKVNKNSEGQVLTGGRWAGFFLNNVGTNVFSFVRDCMLYYFENKDYLINFYIQNYCIKIAYDHFKTVRDIIDSQSIFCNHVYYVEECMKRGETLELQEDTYFYKLSYKIFSREQVRQIREYMVEKEIIRD